MSEITVEHNPSEKRLAELGVRDWPIWTKEASEFPWHYDEQERCFLLEGDVVVTQEGGTPVEFGPGDFVTFPAGMTTLQGTTLQGHPRLVIRHSD